MKHVVITDLGIISSIGKMLPIHYDMENQASA